MEPNGDVIIDVPPRALLYHKDRRGLLAPAVASGCLTRLESGHEPLGERGFRPFEGRGDPVHRFGTGKNVSLGAVGRALLVARPGVGGGTGHDRDPTSRVDDGELAAVSPGKGVFREESVDDLLGRKTLAKKVNALRTVAYVEV